LKNDTILVTGSEGLIGRELSKKLEEAEFEVIRFDIKKDQNILDKKSLEKIICQVKGVVHLAAVSRVIEGYKAPYDTAITNIVGTTNILDLIRKINPSCWMIFGSSREVYGRTNNIVRETDPQKPINVYGASKSAAEYLSLCYGDNYNLRTFIVRFSNVYGGLNDHKDRVIPRFFTQALKNAAITINGGDQIFDFVHLSDVVDGIIKLVQKIINNENLDCKIFHFLTGQTTSLIDLANKIIKLTNSSSVITYLPKREYDVDTFRGDPSQTMKTLEWQPKILIDEGLEHYIKLIRKYWNS
jgi:nucleoside-diphosphate-sugar epimerase